MATPYKHSNSFARLKGLTETLKNNLTTSQYLQIFDEYLDNAIIPIVSNTAFFDTFICSILGWQERNFRRKVSFLNRVEVPSLVINFLLQPTAEARVAAYKKLQLDRGIRIEFVRLFEDRLKPYIQACNCELKDPNTGEVDLSYCLRVKTVLEESFKARTPLLSTCLESLFWLDKALSFKQLILEKYVRLCLTNAQRDYVNFFNHEIDLDDIVQLYLLVASRAIDKCDSRQGALTSHIQNWFMTGRVRAKQQYHQRLASQSTETVNWEALLADEISTSLQEKTLEDKDDQSLIRMLAKIADPTGAARAYLGIEEVLRESEIEQLTKPKIQKEQNNDTPNFDRRSTLS